MTGVDAAERTRILSRFRDHSRRFDSARARRRAAGTVASAPPVATTREHEQTLTVREIEVLQLAADGYVNREIGERLFLSEETVKSHVANLLAKLQARSRTHAVTLGFRSSLIH
jgi:DNA-binding NarL/FixJ family response regulator